MKQIDWKILAVLSEKRSITQAAEALFMTQSALTKRLKGMEAEWNVEIVKRTRTGVVFTEDGRYLSQKATIMLDFLQEIEDHFSAGTDIKELVTLGVPNAIARLHLPGVLKEYQQKHDQLTIHTVINSSNILFNQLVDGSIDLAILCGDFPYAGEKTLLFQENLYALVPKGVIIDQIDQYPLIFSYLNPLVKAVADQWWKGHFGSLPHPAHIVPYSDIAIKMVENGLGVTLLFGTDWDIDRENLQLIPLYDTDGAVVQRPIWLMSSERCFKSERIMNFISFVENYYQAN
jgi:DNA-binding transcriptional LysR family regulator